MAIYYNFFYIICVFILYTQVSADTILYKLNSSVTNEVKEDLPTETDLVSIMNYLDKLINYITFNKICMDFGMKFGLFLLNVNIKPYAKIGGLTASQKNVMDRILKQSANLQKFYDVSLRKTKAPVFNTTKMYVTMLNEKIWSKNIVKLNLHLLTEIYSYDKDQFTDWDSYVTDVDDMYKRMPDPNVSNMCLGLLAKSDQSAAEYVEYNSCQLPHECIKMLDYGTNIGYAVTFKLLFLLVAQLSRRCIIFSVLQDEHIRHHLCKSAYLEADFNSKNGFGKMDLLVDQMSLCSLDGHAQFLRMSWITALLQHQTPQGYFTNAITPLSPEEKRVKRQIGHAYCRDHINPAAVGALAGILRYIFETFY